MTLTGFLVLSIVVLALGAAAALGVRKARRASREYGEILRDDAQRLREGRRHAELDYVTGELERRIEGCDEAAPARRLKSLGATLRRCGSARRAPVSLREVFEEAAREFRATAPQGRVDYSGPGDGDDPWVAADRELLRWALTEIFHNARDHAGRWSGITARASAGDGFVTVTVGDDGDGLGTLQASRLYGPFTPRVGSAGPGLGLFVVRQIVEAMGGSVTGRPSAEGGLAHEIRLARAGDGGGERAAPPA